MAEGDTLHPPQLRRAGDPAPTFGALQPAPLRMAGEIPQAVGDFGEQPPQEDMMLDYVVDTSGDKSTASTEWEDVDPTNLSLTITVPAGGRRVKVTFSANVYNSAYDWTYLDLAIAGSRIGGTSGLALFRASTFEHRSITVDLFLNPGDWTVRPQWRVGGGTSFLYASASAPAVLDALQVPL